uniref:Cyclin-dependent kinase 2-associated protein 1 n=1 Tax=Oncorhynchus tshawytscha TaxID=74940 RepID=A0A8C8MB28_ONCTS
MSLGMSYKPNVHQHIPGTSGNQVGNIPSPSAANLATLQSYRPLVNDVYAPPSLGFTQGSSSSQVPQSKYSELLAIIEELGKEIRPTYAGSKSAMERIKRGNVETSVIIQYLYCVVTQIALSRLHISPLPTNSNLVRELSFSR